MFFVIFPLQEIYKWEEKETVLSSLDKSSLHSVRMESVYRLILSLFRLIYF